MSRPSGALTITICWVVKTAAMSRFRFKGSFTWHADQDVRQQMLFAYPAGGRPRDWDHPEPAHDHKDPTESFTHEARIYPENCSCKCHFDGPGLFAGAGPGRIATG